MEQRFDRKKILWAALVMVIGAALVTGPAKTAEGDAPGNPGPGAGIENPGGGPRDPGPGDPSPRPGGRDQGPRDRDDDEDRAGDRGVIIGGPPIFQAGPQPGPGPVPVPAPEPDRDRPDPVVIPLPELPDRTPDRPDTRPNTPPSTRIDNFQNAPTANAPLVSAQPSPSHRRENSTRTPDAAYDSGSSIIFKSAQESAVEENTFGITAGQEKPQSSMQQMVVGTIVAVDKAKNTVVLKDRYRHTRTFFVDAGTAQTLKKGNVVQATFLPGTSKIERLQQIIG